MARSLSRGLQMIAMLNQRENCNVADFSKYLNIPRATTHRILATLVREGYIIRHPSDHRFRLTLKVRTLSEGMSDEQYTASVARPFLAAVTEQLRWPVSFGALSGVDLIVWENTDGESPLAADKFNIGYKMPITTTATGLCILAHLDKAGRKALNSALSLKDPGSRLSDSEQAVLEKTLRQIRSRGYATYHRRRSLVDAISIAVPIIDKAGRVRGAVTIRYARAAVPLAFAESNFVPALKEASHRIAAHLHAVSH